MKKTLIYMAIAAASVLSASAARALTFPPPPTIKVPGYSIVDGEGKPWEVDLELDLDNSDPENNLYAYFQAKPLRLTFTGGDQIEIRGLDSILDPFGSFAINHTDIGAPSQFSNTLVFPDFAPTLFNRVTFGGDVGFSITDGTPTKNGVSMTPIAPNPTIFNYTIFNVDGTPLASFGLLPGQSFPGAGPGESNTHTDNFLRTPFQVDCGSIGCGFVEVRYAFQGSGGFDRYVFSGSWEVLEANQPTGVPEPSLAGALIGAGLAGATFLRRRKRV